MADRHQVSDLVGLLSASLGDEKARDAVRAAAEQLGLREQVIDREQALAVLEKIAAKPGLVGIAARFAKTRVHLKW